jgi:hypothetical protein
MGENPKSGNIFAFSNNKNNIKLMQQKEDGISLLVKKTIKPIKWFEYQPADKPEHTVRLSGKEREQFLQELGCPASL